MYRCIVVVTGVFSQERPLPNRERGACAVSDATTAAAGEIRKLFGGSDHFKTKFIRDYVTTQKKTIIEEPKNMKRADLTDA